MAKALCPESLEETLDRQKIKFIYLVTTFQNPTGRTLSKHRAGIQVAEIVQRHGALVIEDDPYSDLRYSGEAVPPFYTYAPENTVYVSTVSKVFAPGLRLGFCVAPSVIHEWLYTPRNRAQICTATRTLRRLQPNTSMQRNHLRTGRQKSSSFMVKRLEAMLDSNGSSTCRRDYRWTQAGRRHVCLGRGTEQASMPSRSIGRRLIGRSPLCPASIST